MGIRYLGISADREDCERVAAGPCPTCGARPQLRDDDSGEVREVLDLDKSWGDLQHILRQDPPRPGALLVAGDVTNTSTGWISHQGVVGPDDVPAVAADLATVTNDELRRLFQRDGEWINEYAERDLEYVAYYLEQAVTFTRTVAAAGRGIVYYIG